MLNNLSKLNPSKGSVGVISTGLYSLDNVLQIKGIKRGHIVEVYGSDNTCKTSFILNMIQRAQSDGCNCALMDLDNSIDPHYMENIGIKDDLIITKTESGEDSFSIMKALMESNIVDLLIVDSIASICPSKELLNKIDSNDFNSQSKLIQSEIESICSLAMKTNTVVVFTNHLKRVINNRRISYKTISEPWIKFYSSLRFKLNKLNNINDGVRNIGSTMKLSITKSPYYITTNNIEFNITYKYGISTELDLINLCIKLNILETRSTWFYLDNILLSQGKTNLEKKIRSDNDLKQKLITKLREIK